MDGTNLSACTLSRFLSKCRIQLVKQREAILGRASGGQCAEAGFGVELGDTDGGEFLHELIDAHGAAAGEFAHCRRQLLFVCHVDALPALRGVAVSRNTQHSLPLQLLFESELSVDAELVVPK
jgi:hypothetical protein